jgi:uncharacterized protein (TIGR03435 family)
VELKHLARLLTVALASVVTSAAQPASGEATFEVASVRPSAEPGGVQGGCRGIDSRFAPGDVVPPLGRCRITNARLSHLIVTAFKAPLVRYLKGAPDWAISGAERYTIEAKCADPEHTTEDQLLEMLRNLLVERFGL